jgi:hypothetical protein
MDGDSWVTRGPWNPQHVDAAVIADIAAWAATRASWRLLAVI